MKDPFCSSLMVKSVSYIPNEVFLWVIMARIENYEVLKILIDGRSSCDIMYSKLFRRFGLEMGRLSLYVGINLQTFNGSVTHPWGIIEIVITLKEGRHAKEVDV